MARVRHLSVRNGVYYYSRRLTLEVFKHPALHEAIFQGKSHFRVSLKTKDQGKALQLFQDADAMFRSKLSLVLGGQKLDVEIHPLAPRTPPRKLTPDLLDQIESALSVDAVTRWRTKLAAAEISDLHRDEFQREVEARIEDAEALAGILHDGLSSKDPRMPDIRSIAMLIAREENIDIEDDVALAVLKSSVRKGLVAAERAVDDLLSRGKGSMSAIEQRYRSAPTLSQMFESYESSKNRPRTVNEIREASRAIVKFLGNVRANRVSAADVRNFFRSQGQRRVGGKDPNSVERPMSEATMRKKLALIRAGFNFAIKRGELDMVNPASGIDVAVFAQPRPAMTMPRKRPFRVPELQSIFEYPWFTGCQSPVDTHSPGDYRLQGMHFWVPVVAALTGLRAGELGGLKIAEIAIDDKYPHIFVQPNEFRPTKNGQSRRVPILDCLDAIGFSSFVELRRQSGNARLFDDWKAPRRTTKSESDTAWSNGSIIRAFNRTIVPRALEREVNGQIRLDVTFHSFRGAFKSMLGLHRHGLSPNFINEVIGHSKNELDERYVGEIPIEETYPAMRSCTYAGLALPLAPC